MNRTRRRVAIGMFAAIGEVEAVIARLHALGIARYECFLVSADHTASDLEGGQPSDPADLPPSAGPAMLRIYLETMADEQSVVAALLGSAARSVQLHDIDSPATTPLRAGQ